MADARRDTRDFCNDQYSCTHMGENSSAFVIESRAPAQVYRVLSRWARRGNIGLPGCLAGPSLIPLTHIHLWFDCPRNPGCMLHRTEAPRLDRISTPAVNP